MQLEGESLFGGRIAAVRYESEIGCQVEVGDTLVASPPRCHFFKQKIIFGVPFIFFFSVSK